MFAPNHSSFNHSDSFQKKTPIYIRVYISLSLSLSYAGARTFLTRGREPFLRGGANLSYAGARTFIRGVQKNLGPGERARKRARAEGGRRSGWPQEARVQALPPRTLPRGRPGEKNGPTGLSGKNGGTGTAPAGGVKTGKGA